VGLRSIGADFNMAVVASASGRLTPHRAPPYEELDLRHEFAHLFSENQQKLLLPKLHSLTPVCTKSFVGWGLAPDPTRLPIPLARFKGPYF